MDNRICVCIINFVNFLYIYVGVNNKSNYLFGVIFRVGFFYMREKFI